MAKQRGGDKGKAQPPEPKKAPEPIKKSPTGPRPTKLNPRRGGKK